MVEVAALPWWNKVLPVFVHLVVVYSGDDERPVRWCRSLRRLLFRRHGGAAVLVPHLRSMIRWRLRAWRQDGVRWIEHDLPAARIRIKRAWLHRDDGCHR